LNFLHPSIFSSVDSFEKWFQQPFANLAVGVKDEKDKQIAMTEEEKLLVIDRLHSMLRPFMLRREKKDVEKDLADKLEKILRCEVRQIVFASM
jgi:ATP-dependent helicase STH1/SNF2